MGRDKGRKISFSRCCSHSFFDTGYITSLETAGQQVSVAPFQAAVFASVSTQSMTRFHFLACLLRMEFRPFILQVKYCADSAYTPAQLFSSFNERYQYSTLVNFHYHKCTRWSTSEKQNLLYIVQRELCGKTKVLIFIHESKCLSHGVKNVVVMKSTFLSACYAYAYICIYTHIYIYKTVTRNTSHQK